MTKKNMTTLSFNYNIWACCVGADLFTFPGFISVTQVINEVLTEFLIHIIHCHILASHFCENTDGCVSLRFVLSSIILALALSVVFAALSVVRDATGFLRLLPVAVLIVLFTSVLLVASAGCAVRLKANAAASSVGLVLALLLPAVGNYYLADALSKGGTVPWAYVGCAALATLPAVLLFLFLGIHFINGRDIS